MKKNHKPDPELRVRISRDVLSALRIAVVKSNGMASTRDFVEAALARQPLIKILLPDSYEAPF